MRRLAALGLIGGLAAMAWALWASIRDLREPWAPFPEAEDGIQTDPYLVSQPIGGM